MPQQALNTCLHDAWQSELTGQKRGMCPQWIQEAGACAEQCVGWPYLSLTSSHIFPGPYLPELSALHMWQGTKSFSFKCE